MLVVYEQTGLAKQLLFLLLLNTLFHSLGSRSFNPLAFNATEFSSPGWKDSFDTVVCKGVRVISCHGNIPVYIPVTLL